MPSACSDSAKTEPSEEYFAQAREVMVESQIETRGIEDERVLAAMREVKRHLFVPEDLRYLAYGDHPLPIGEDQTISQPYIVAVMTQLLHLDGPDKVLEVGTGSGYQAAVLGEIASEVYTIEIVEQLAKRSEKLLQDLGYDNVHVRHGDGFLGWPEEGPFDAIIVTCAPPEIPEPLKEQLADSGRMVIPVGTDWQELMVLEKHDGKIEQKSVLPVRFVPMTGDGVKNQD